MTHEDIFQEAADRPSAALPSGALLRDQFRIGRVLGVGGFGITYLAFDEVLEMAVAVKEYLPNHIAARRNDGETLQPQSRTGKTDFHFGMERFLQEARTLAKFEDHPNIVRVRSFFEENGTAYLVMNYYQGRTLEGYLQSRESLLPEEEALYISHEILSGLRAAHREDILHRDVDPSNVYLADSGRVVLLDFGAARRAMGERTQTLSVMLKRGYAPHEQYYSHGEQGPWTDIYACAATLYRLLTGFKPPEAAGRVPDDDLVPPGELTPTISEATHRAVMKGLSLWPKDRPQSVDAFQDGLPPSPGPQVAGWTGGDDAAAEEPATSTDGSTDSRTSLRVWAPAACRLFIDGGSVIPVPADTVRSIPVEPGVHRLRAIRSEPEDTGSATLTVTAVRPSGTTTGSSTTLSLDRVMWQEAVEVQPGRTNRFDIQFESTASDDAAADASAPASTTAFSDSPAESSPDAPASGASDTIGEEDIPSAPVRAESTGSASPNGQTGPATWTAESTEHGAAPDGSDAGTESDEQPSGTAAASDSSTTVSTATLLLRSNADGRLFIDGRRCGRIEAESVNRLQVRPGTRTLHAVEADGQRTWSQTVSLVVTAPTSVSIKFGDADETTAETEQPEEKRETTESQDETIPSPDVAALRETVGEGLRAAASAVQNRDWDRRLPSVGKRRVLMAAAMAVVVLTVSAWWVLHNRPPTATSETVHTPEGPTVIDVVENDRDPDGDPLTIRSIESLPAEVGRATRAGSTSIRLDLAASFAGTARFDYVVEDEPGDTARAEVVVQRPFPERPTVHIASRRVAFPQDVAAADLDGDGDRDLAAVSYDNQVVWMEHRDGSDTTRTRRYAPPRTLDDAAAGAISIDAADLDGDGDQDLLAAAFRDDRIRWYENRTVAESDTTAGADRDPRFASPRTFAGGVPGAMTVRAADLDGDGDQDVLLAARSGGWIGWCENRGQRPTGVPNFTAPKRIARSIDGMEEVRLADLDEDGDRDVIVAAYSENRVLWVENRQDASGNAFAEPKSIGTGADAPLSVAAADLDGDGDRDVLAGLAGTDRVVWYPHRSPMETSDSTRSFGDAREIAEGVADPESIDARDVDGDGAPDVVTSSFGGSDIVWHINEGQAKRWSSQTLSQNAPEAMVARLLDLDGDGDRDVLIASQANNTISWIENRLSDPGEAAPPAPEEER